MNHSPKIIIIGAGIAGIAAAIRLAVQGMQVEVYEQNAYAGGKIHAFENDGYRFDAGPSLFTMPDTIRELFELSGEDISNYFTYKRLDITCRYMYEDGTVINAYADRNLLSREIEEKTGDPAAAVLQYLERSGTAYRNIGEVFTNHSLHKRTALLKVPIMRALRSTRWPYLFHSLNRFNTASFTDQKNIQLFNRFATYNGSDPYQAPAMLSLVPHVEFNEGVYYPAGGMVSIADALYRLAVAKGVQFYFGKKVQRIIRNGNKVSGIVVAEENIMADAVISNLDVYFTYRQLLDEEHTAHKLLKQERSSSALIYYWGMRKPFPELQLHNIFFSSDYREEFNHIFRLKKQYHDPTVYVNITSKEEPGVHAPEGKENWFVMVNTPSDNGHDWALMQQQYRSAIIRKLNHMLQADLEPCIEFETTLDPLQIERTTGSYAGSLYGTSSNSRIAAFLRHPNFSRQIQGLYFIGGSVHPGGGIPLCLKSARITCGIIQKDMRHLRKHH
jgi:phytoene desaturase